MSAEVAVVPSETTVSGDTPISDSTRTRFKAQGKKRKRAPKACLSYRARKVRCDVSQRGRPCMNCYLDSEMCVATSRASRLSVFVSRIYILLLGIVVHLIGAFISQRAQHDCESSQVSCPSFAALNTSKRPSAEEVVKSRPDGLPMLNLVEQINNVVDLAGNGALMSNNVDQDTETEAHGDITNEGVRSKRPGDEFQTAAPAYVRQGHHYAAIPIFSATTHLLQHSRQNTLKRLWWCCIIRGRTLGLLMRRPVQIMRAHFDFDENPTLELVGLADEFDKSRLYRPGTKRFLTEILAQIVELYAVLMYISMLVFPLDDTPGWGREMKPEDSAHVRDCRSTLRRCRLVLCHHEVLHLAILQVAPSDKNTVSRDVSVIYENQHELQDAASGVTECLKEFVQLWLARWLPISAVACMTLPLALNILDVKLSANKKEKNKTLDSNVASDSKQHRLNILIEAMRTYQPQYDGVDWVSEIVCHIAYLAQFGGRNQETSGLQNGINDWTDIIASQPGWYLRLALSLDLSLSKSRLPEDGDFPVSLRGLFTGRFSPLKPHIGSTYGVSNNGKNSSSLIYQGRARNSDLSDDSQPSSSESLSDLQNRSHMTVTEAPTSTNTLSSEGLGMFAVGDSSPSTSNEFWGLYMDGLLPDIPEQWIENLW
ncbi:Fungal specific transcription factor domain, partial [Geosmithia morbida]